MVEKAHTKENEKNMWLWRQRLEGYVHKPRNASNPQELEETRNKTEIQMTANKYKKCSTSLSIREMQIKTTLRFHFTPLRLAMIKKTSNNKCW
jgi:hypothetical protein